MSITGPGYPSTDGVFAASFKKARELARLTQEEVADQMAERGFAFHQATVYKLENGTRKVSIAEATALASILGLPLQLLVGAGAGGLDASAWEMLAEARELLTARRDVVERMWHVEASRMDLESLVSKWEQERGEAPLANGVSPRQYFTPLLELTGIKGAEQEWLQLLEDRRVQAIVEDLGFDVRVTEG